MIASIARALVVVAAIGWAACIIVSLLSFAGVGIPAWTAGAFFVGVFPLWLVTFLLLQKQMPNFSKGGWSVAFRGCPRWLRYAIWATWGYGLLSFLLGAGGPFEVKGLGFIAVFYATSLGVFVTTVATRNDPTECINGHSIGALDKFCPECGAEIKRNAVELVS